MEIQQTAVIGENGWTAASEPPDNDRMVQLAWDDGSYGPSSLGFYDGISEIPDSGKRFYWSKSYGHWTPHKIASTVYAWREIDTPSNCN